MITIESVSKKVKNNMKPSLRRWIKGGVKSFIKPREFRAYCIGTAKSGTHSIADIFSQSFRSAHEPESAQLIYLKSQFDTANISQELVRTFIKKRDLRLGLEMESSDFAGYFFEDFLELYPDSKFILPVRDCYTFLDSIINHQLNGPVEPGSIWELGRDINYGNSGTEHPAEECNLKPLDGIYPLRGYLTYWAKRNKRVLESVPSYRLLAFRTNQIHGNLDSISRFLGIHLSGLDTNKSHRFKAQKKYNYISEISPEYIDQIVSDTGCKEIMDEFFPEIKSAQDVFFSK